MSRERVVDEGSGKGEGAQMFNFLFIEFLGSCHVFTMRTEIQSRVFQLDFKYSRAPLQGIAQQCAQLGI